MDEDDAAIDALAQAVLDGDPIDWPDAESAHPERRRLIEHLRFVAALARTGRESVDHPPEDSPSVQPSHWGHLRLVERIGAGAFGEIYRAWDARLERDVALKLLPAHASDSDAEAILREGRLLARIRHPNVVTVHGADLIGEHAGLWMELVQGRTLEALLQDGETFAPSDVARIGTDLAHALHAVHQAGLLHRDVKAQNVMREDNGRIVLMDFGTGLRLDEQHGSVAGTPLYLAPEVFQGQPASPQSDVYSLGALLFRLLTRSFPVQAETLEALRRAHEDGEHAERLALLSDTPRTLARVVARAIDPRPEARYPDAATMGVDLERAAVRRRRWPWPGAAAAAAVAVVALAWFSPERPIVGVLPFDVPGSNGGDNVLAEGLAIDLNRRLAQVDGLSAIFAPVRKGTPRDLQAVGRQLGANHVLLTSVIGESASIRRIDTSLVRLADEHTVWQESFAPANGDLFAIREKIAIEVGRSLGLRPSGGRRTHQIDPVLQQLFLNAQGYRARRDSQSTSTAVTLLEEINRVDPTFAPAAAALSRTLLTVVPDRETEPPLDPRAESLALGAHTADATSPEANAARGLLCAYRHDWECARRFFHEAIRLDPGMTSTHVDFVISTLLPLGEVGEGLRLLEDAREKDPMSLEIKRTLAHLQEENGLYDQAIATSTAIMAGDPDLRYVDAFFARALYLSGRTQPERTRQALDFLMKRERLWAYRGYLLAVLGRHDEARELLAQHPRDHVRRMLIYGGLGDRDRAFEELRAAAVLDPWLAVTWMRRAEMEVLRSDPRYDEIRSQLLRRR
jgi:serine/threonine protein kinase/tetratricopeptide (TPR) repeat protein